MTPCFLYLMMRPGRIAGPAAGDRAGADLRKGAGENGIRLSILGSYMTRNRP
jgi:hypothetical protein